MKQPLRIALLESDDLVRALAQAWLLDAGHQVVTVMSADATPLAGLDLVIADAPSPRSAAALLARLHSIYTAPVLLVSARLNRGQGRSAALAAQLGVAGVLPKPFTRRELLAAVARTVGGP